MSCLFCESNYHLSQNCDIYVTNQSREEKAESKNCCKLCLTERNRNSYNRCGGCRKYRKCNICFSIDHHTVYCPDRFDVSNLFLPKIDQYLVPRFMEIFDPEERHSLFISSPITAKIVKPKFITVVKTPDNETYSSDRTLAINKCLEIIGTHKYLPPLKSIIFKGKILYIKNATILKSELLKFLTPKLEQFICCNVEFIEDIEVSNSTVGVTVAEIFKRAPNIEILDFKDINFKILNTWPDDILQWKKGNGLTKLRIPIHDINYNVKSLATIIKEKATKNVKISLYVFSKHLCYNAFARFCKRMLQYFSHYQFCAGENLVYINVNNKEHNIEFITLKDFKCEASCSKGN